MAKQEVDRYTRDLFGKNPVGRPRKANPLTAAERARRYLQRHKFNMLAPTQPLDRPARFFSGRDLSQGELDV